jgi:ATP-binding cassette subfamily F protein uup
MSLLLNCQSISKSFGVQKLFEGVSFTISDGDRLGVIGPNGSGKSTLLRILAGMDDPDAGEVNARKLVRCGYVAQDSVFQEGLSIRAVLENSVSATPLAAEDRAGKVASTLGVVGFADADLQAASLSGGWRKRLSIAEALVKAPDILMLDEPTNHLDMEGIAWLEKLLINASFAVILVSHDRYFLENASNSVAELNKIYPGGIFRVEGNYSRFLERRAEFQSSQQKLEESLATKVKREVEWLRRGAKARTTKSKARIDQAGKLIGQLDDVTSRRQSSVAGIDFTASGRKTKKLIETVGLSAAFGERVLFRDLSLRLSPGVRVGLVGPNGSGKTTLLRMLAGEAEPTSGTIERADNLNIVYFDQNREQINPETTVRRTLAPDGDSVRYMDQVIHVASWANRFLFRSDQLDMAAGRLSGGERARLLIARLMLQPSDVLLLDEPTNDLDIATLEVLEDSLTSFPGAMVLVTHDRFLLDRVSTTIVGLDALGRGELFADCAQWEQWIARRKAEESPKPKAAVVRGEGSSSKKRLSYIEAREMEGIEDAILKAEEQGEFAKLEMDRAAAVADGELLKTSYEAMQRARDEVDRLYARWAELGSKIS